MKYIEYHNLVDRGGWGQGPWDSEPDKIQYIDEETGLPCIIRRNDMGALCGYVGVSKGHPYYGKHWDEVNPKVHGGITFTNKCQEDEHGICHKVESGEDDDVWWLGFDCAHAGDFVPRHSRLMNEFEKYRDVNYVKDQISFLAKQLKNYKEVFGEA